ncbi:hypothetical protein NDU88_004166 [Pleurodeles waltl]|uniref:Uncharacterized protein n=1 Tax=Pleurodeles waltl TaxID=8319 RepID=A0AAV7M990_PLEWA|nr:hypothetical protein NDU88_004166 [Pleurodeles waltl]
MAPGAPRVGAGKACTLSVCPRSSDAFIAAEKKNPGAASRKRVAPRCINAVKGGAALPRSHRWRSAQRGPLPHHKNCRPHLLPVPKF